jgi:molybdopterin-biosynthesis enzyme MoeA-like protein
MKFLTGEVGQHKQRFSCQELSEMGIELLNHLVYRIRQNGFLLCFARAYESADIVMLCGGMGSEPKMI